MCVYDLYDLVWEKKEILTNSVLRNKESKWSRNLKKIWHRIGQK